jgi:hypothetical protein
MNTITLISVAELLDGRNFFIPAYQRGYRWSEDQMLDLLDDLYEFAIRDKKKDSKNDSAGEFYCLQPIIVQRVTQLEKLDGIKRITGWGDSVTEESTWEVVDGQQRLTSIYILFRYLLEEEVTSEKKLKKANIELYHLCYETRPETRSFLEDLSLETLSDDNIDYAFISNAYKTIEKWLEDRGPRLAVRYGKRNSSESILGTLNALLQTRREDYGEATGSAQFIWYELAADSQKNPIDEFVSINNGKIRLTDSELIKGLILQKRNFVGNEEAEQMKIALQWEEIENTLHLNDFWNFLSDSEEEDNRIELLFQLRYYQDKAGKLEDGDLFRFYLNDLLSVQPGHDLEIAVKKEWKNIMSIFYILQEWYEDPILYNIIGFLIHSGAKLQDIMKLHSDIDSNASKDTFYDALNNMIEEKLPSREEVSKEEIKCNYTSNLNGVRRLLLFLNIYQLNKQISELRKIDVTFMTPAYKFPFDLYVSQDWDVEHIDSATRNDLRDVEQKEEWLHQSLLGLDIKENDEIKQWFDDKNYDAIWEFILSKIQYSAAADDDEKNGIGNLTLLDSRTNRGYKNAIFAYKRVDINNAMRSGRFIPVCTQLVFNKSFENQTVNLREWSAEDKKSYETFILKELKEFYAMGKDVQLNLFE